MPAALALFLLSTAAVSVENVIRWLPANTETLLVARSPSRMTPFDGKGLCPTEVRSLVAVGLPGTDPGKAKISYEFVVDGSRKFRAPKSLGLWPYEGCKILGLKPAEYARLQAKYKKSAKRRLKIEGLDVFEVSERAGTDKWTYRFVFVDGLMLCATDKGYLAEVLKRRVKGGSGRALPDTLPQWKHIDKKAPFWVVRQFTPEANKAWGGADMGDPKLVGYAMELSQDEKRFKVVSISRDPKGFEEAKGPWHNFFVEEQAPPPTLKRLDDLTTEIMFDGQKAYGGRLSFLLLAAVGHPVFV